MECPLAFQRLALSELVFVTEKAEKKENQFLTVNSHAVKGNNGLLSNKNHNAEPMIVANVDRKEQSFVFEYVM